MSLDMCTLVEGFRLLGGNLHKRCLVGRKRTFACSGMLSAIPLLSRRDSTVEYRDTTLLVNASIQAGNRDVGLNDPEVVHI